MPKMMLTRFKQKPFLGLAVTVWVLIFTALSAPSEGNIPLIKRAAKGTFLIADPRLTDPNFRESVVLLTYHGADGSMGVIINRPTAQPLFDLLPDLNRKIDASDTLFIGGPVSRSQILMLLQAEQPPREMERVFENIYFSPDARRLAGLIEEAKQFRAYAGYAGWGSGQLEAEIDRGDWRILPADPAMLFRNDPETVWPEMFRRSQQRSVDLGPGAETTKEVRLQRFGPFAGPHPLQRSTLPRRSFE